MTEYVIMEAADIEATLKDLAGRVLAAHPENERLLLIGVQRRGADIARRLAPLLGNAVNAAEIGSLDINLYRDDWTMLADGVPHIGVSRVPVLPDGRPVLLVDDVLFSGRTVRAALEAILDYGRPTKVELLALVDRGHRELPIHADYVGVHIDTKKEQHIDVLLQERDGRDAILLR